MAQEIAEQDRARGSIQATVRQHGTRLQAATPTAIIATLVAAACMPVVWSPDPLKAVVALFGSVGSGYISEFLRGAIDRLRSQDGAPPSEAEIQQALEHELLACLEAGDERAARLRADAGALLQAVRGVEAALVAASTETRHTLSAAFVELGAQFEDFRGMLAQIHVRQGDQFDLLREILVKIDARPRSEPAPAMAVSAAFGSEPDDAPPAPGPCPYMGLEAFQAEDAEWFFGREQLVAELTVRLSEKPFLAVVGPSGSGKSSVLRAGLLPAVLGGRLAWARAWTAIVLTPGSHPLEELAIRVAQRGGVAAGSLLVDLRDDPRRLSLAVRQALLDVPDAARLLLLVDQFEEVFTLCSDEAERRRFIQALVGLADQPGSGATVVLGIRADFLARCTEYAELKPAAQDHQVWVGPMTTAELRSAITGPAARAGLELEPGLVETVLADLGDEPGSLPLLSHALFATWQRRRGRRLTLAGYQDAGGVRQAIGQTAQTVYAELDPAQQAIAKDVFLRLTALGEGTEDTRRRASRAELGDEPDVELVLDRLTEARLITLDKDSVQVAHEALIREWPTLRRWLTEDREGLRIHRRLTEAATEWETLGRDLGALYRGARLATARDWAEDNEERLNDLEREFLAASSEQEQGELAAARRRNRRLRALSAVLVVLLAVAVWQQRVAQWQRNLAIADQLAARATATLGQQPLSLLLSLESLRLTPTDEARTALLHGLLEPRHNVVAIINHTDQVFGVAFSPDGEVVASASADRTVRLWNPATGNPIGQPLTGHTDRVFGVTFSPDGTTIATASADQTVRLWDTNTGQPIGQPLTGHTGAVWKVVFSPDGTTITSISDDRTARLWDAATSAPIGQPLTGHTGAVKGVAFSPDGTTIATASDDQTVRLWATTIGAPIGQPLTGHTDQVFGVAFSPDGTTIATTSHDQTVRLWNAATGKPIGQPLTGHTGRVYGVAFSSNGKTIATASRDQTIRRWDAATGQPIGQPLTGHTDTVVGVVFSPDGATIATASGDQTVRLWNAATGQPIGQPLTGHTDQVETVTFSPDGKTIASASYDRTVRRWDATTGAPIGQPLTGHTDWIFGVAFSPDGATIATASADQTVRLWNANTGAPIGQPLTGHTSTVFGVVFSPDGTTIATASGDQTVQRWDAHTGELLSPPLTGHTDPVRGVAFSLDGKMIASASYDQTVRLWPATMKGWIRHACTLAKRNLTQDEWNEFVGPDRPYVRACADLPSGHGAPPDAPAAT